MPETNDIDNLLIGDIGGLEIPDIDLSLIDLVPTDGVEDTRYIKPKVAAMKSEYICFDNAVKLAKELRLDKGGRFDCFVSGSFIFGDFIEAYLVNTPCCAKTMTISTLSLSQDNVCSLQLLMDKGYIQELNLIVSAYFWSYERSNLVPYLYECLDVDNRFQLAVAGIHTKTVNFETLGGKKIVIHGSANLRSSGNIEQMTIEESPELFDFYQSHYDGILDKYKTINKPIRHQKAWEALTSPSINK